VRTRRSYRDLRERSQRAFNLLGGPGRALYRGVRGGAHGFLSRLTNNEALYSNLDIKYIGPVDGHDLHAMEEALTQAKHYGAPVIVHAITEKGRGFQPARDDDADQFHAVGVIDPETGEPVGASARLSWTAVFSEEMLAVAEADDRVVAITAAMLTPSPNASPSGSTTSGSPSSMRSPLPQGSPSVVCTRWWPCTRRS
jgi:1-deoxy-D-xylulose-5-phosphate synthase